MQARKLFWPSVELHTLKHGHVKPRDICAGVVQRYGSHFFLMGVVNDKAMELRICEVSQFMVDKESVDPDGQHS